MHRPLLRSNSNLIFLAFIKVACKERYDLGSLLDHCIMRNPLDSSFDLRHYWREWKVASYLTITIRRALP